jgi:hypothetical protein
MRPTFWIATCLATLALGACHQATLISPSLSPVDDKPRFEFPKVSESSCTSYILHMIPTGGDPLKEATSALTDKKVADGYVEVTGEQATVFWILGHTTCTTIAARPFKYVSRKTSKPRPKPPTKTVRKPKAPLVDCGIVCERYGKIAATQGLLQQDFTKRCKRRCPADRLYHQCVTRASTPRAAAQCEGGKPGR